MLVDLINNDTELRKRFTIKRIIKEEDFFGNTYFQFDFGKGEYSEWYSRHKYRYELVKGEITRYEVRDNFWDKLLLCTQWGKEYLLKKQKKEG